MLKKIQYNFFFSLMRIGSLIIRFELRILLRTKLDLNLELKFRRKECWKKFSTIFFLRRGVRGKGLKKFFSSTKRIVFDCLGDFWQWCRWLFQRLKWLFKWLFKWLICKWLFQERQLLRIVWCGSITFRVVPDTDLAGYPAWLETRRNSKYRFFFFKKNIEIFSIQQNLFTLILY